MIVYVYTRWLRVSVSIHRTLSIIISIRFRKPSSALYLFMQIHQSAGKLLKARYSSGTPIITCLTPNTTVPQLSATLHCSHAVPLQPVLAYLTFCSNTSLTNDMHSFIHLSLLGAPLKSTMLTVKMCSGNQAPACKLSPDICQHK